MQGYGSTKGKSNIAQAAYQSNQYGVSSPFKSSNGTKKKLIENPNQRKQAIQPQHRRSKTDGTSGALMHHQQQDPGHFKQDSIQDKSRQLANQLEQFEVMREVQSRQNGVNAGMNSKITTNKISN